MSLSQLLKVIFAILYMCKFKKKIIAIVGQTLTSGEVTLARF